MSHENGTFVLLKDGTAKCYSPKFHEHIVPRLNELYREAPGADYLIVQVVGTVPKPSKPIINSFYAEKS